MPSADIEIRTLLERRSEAIRAKDLERLMAVYAPDIAYFDLVPPLRYVGSATLRERFSRWFEGWKSAIVQEIGEVTVEASENVGTAHMLIRAGGTLVDGREVGYWVRTSNALRRSSQGWLITHEHVSLPVDFKTGRAVMDLVP